MNGGGGQLSLVAARGPPAGQRGSVHLFWRLIPLFNLSKLDKLVSVGFRFSKSYLFQDGL